MNQLDKSLWTDADFDRMGWHDAHVWALAFLGETDEFVLDLDYIVEWVAPPPGEEYYHFWVVPATLVFENVTGLEITLEPFTDVSLDTITRSEPGVPLNAEFIGKSTDWLYDLDFHVGGIRLRSAGYRQYLRGPAVRSRTQHLPLADRGGISFARETHRPTAVNERITARGAEMSTDWPAKIRAAQLRTTCRPNGVETERVRYGAEKDDWGADRGPCHDCGVVKGEFHVPGCDVERCPACGGQIGGCECDWPDHDE